MNTILIELRPQMIPLVELKSDELQDQCYLSAIGNKYGDIYEKQLELAMGSRMNKKPKPDYWDTLVKPMMQSGQISAPQVIKSSDEKTPQQNNAKL